MDKPKSLTFLDAGSNLVLMFTEILINGTLGLFGVSVIGSIMGFHPPALTSIGLPEIFVLGVFFGSLMPNRVKIELDPGEYRLFGQLLLTFKDGGENCRVEVGGR